MAKQQFNISDLSDILLSVLREIKVDPQRITGAAVEMPDERSGVLYIGLGDNGEEETTVEMEFKVR